MAQARNPAFCGRNDAIEKLEAALIGGSGGALAPVAITGTAGVGKSSIVAEYAYRHSGDYWSVWWVAAQNRQTLVASLTELAKKIDPQLSPDASNGIVGNDSLEPFAKAALSRMRGAPLPWLLIYDNVENPSSISDLLPPKDVHVLLTSLWSDWQGIAEELNLDVFTPKEACNFLLRRANSTDSEGARALAASLGCLPLALDQAGALCKRAGLSFNEYRRRASEFIQMRPADLAYPTSVFGTFSIAMDDAAASCPEAERLMSFFAFLPSDNIPLEYFDQSVMDVLQRTQALEALSAVSLVSFKIEHVRVHRLVQAVMRERVHKAHTFPFLRPIIFAMLRKAVEETGAQTSTGGHLYVFGKRQR